MLVKFARVGKEVKQYYLKDNSTIDDLFEVVDEYLDDDDELIITSSNGTINKYNSDNVDFEDNLIEGSTYFISSIILSNMEKRIIDAISNMEAGIGNICEFNTQESRELVEEILNIVKEYNWDK